MMNAGESQDLQDEIEVYQRQANRTGPIAPLGCYQRLLAIALVGLLVLHGLLIIVLTLSGLDDLLHTLHILFVAPYAWVLAGIGISRLIALWLTNRRTAIILTGALAVLWLILWIVALVKYTHTLKPTFVESNLTIAFAFGVLVLSVCAGLAVVRLGLYILSGHILPLPAGSERDKTFGFLQDWLFHTNFPAYVVVDEPYEEDRIEERVPGDVFAGGAPPPAPQPIGSGLIITDCDYAVAVSSGTKFKGVLGPGVIFTGYAERIEETVDLRPQLRAFHVEALTKDGIKIKVLVFIPFKIDSHGKQPVLGEPLPYDEKAARRAILARRLEHEGKGQTPERTKQRSWRDLARPIAERILQDIISQYNFDDLYGPYQSGGDPPRKLIVQTFCERLARELKPLGLQLVGGGISDLEPADPAVYLERVRAWQADWERKVELARARGITEWLLIVERARADVQADLIIRLGRQLEEQLEGLGAVQAEFRPELATQVLTTILDEMMRQQPTLGQIVPGELQQALVSIRRAMGGG